MQTPTESSTTQRQPAQMNDGGLLSSRERICRLNDRLRKTLLGGRVMLTPGVQSLDETLRAALFAEVKNFDAFTAANDPYAEHDFGRVVVDGQGYFFKIDYYDLDLQHGSPDPSDEGVTARIMTIMREDEY
ncbi:MAG: DUF3768 domain-containing protein [Rhizobium rhizophilum]|uniref:DUF3768 domain-containing protein n=1 Tax=Rhizobium rhizophilum TaxID=1850373 RepID=UPI00391C4A96